MFADKKVVAIAGGAIAVGAALLAAGLPVPGIAVALVGVVAAVLMGRQSADAQPTSVVTSSPAAARTDDDREIGKPVGPAANLPGPEAAGSRLADGSLPQYEDEDQFLLKDPPPPPIFDTSPQSEYFKPGDPNR